MVLLAIALGLASHCAWCFQILHVILLVIENGLVGYCPWSCWPLHVFLLPMPTALLTILHDHAGVIAHMRYLAIRSGSFKRYSICFPRFIWKHDSLYRTEYSSLRAGFEFLPFDAEEKPERVHAWSWVFFNILDWDYLRKNCHVCTATYRLSDLNTFLLPLSLLLFRL